MFKGVEREGGIYYSYEKGPDITHFNYFKNDSSRARLQGRLLRQDGIPAGFRKLSGEPVPDLRRAAPRSMRPWSSWCPPCWRPTCAWATSESGSIYRRLPPASLRS